MLWFIFITLLFLLFYAFLGYPILLALLALISNKPISRNLFFPYVTLIIPVHNEEKTIVAKIDNCLAQNYPEERLSIVVVSDASTDGTEERVKEMKNDRIRFLSLSKRGGKVAAQNHALRICDSDIIIFTDVAILTDPNAVKNIVENFADQTVGAVSCRDFIVGDGKDSQGETNYIRYDMLVRNFTSRFGSLIGVTGGFYAVRKEVALGGWNPAFPPDFYVSIRCMKRRLRVVEDPRVKAYYKTAAREWDELSRKVRTINRGIHALLSKPNRKLLNPFKYGFVSLQLFSHKLLRWCLPFILLGLFVSTCFVMSFHPVLELFFICQLFFYLVVAASLIPATASVKQLKLFRYFAISNIAILKAWFEFFLGKKYVQWQPTKR